MADCERVRCRKCRKVLFSTSNCKILDAHEKEIHASAGAEGCRASSGCSSVVEQSCLYLSEESYPDFVNEAVNESSWTKGKILCPACQARIGSFNFVSGNHCACGSYLVPQVHLLKAKVDWIKVGEVLPHPVSFPNQKVLLSSSEDSDLRNSALLTTLTTPHEVKHNDDSSVTQTPTAILGDSCNDAFYTTVTPSDDLDWAMYGQGSPDMLTCKQKKILQNLKSHPKQNGKQSKLLTRRSKWKKQHLWNISELEDHLCAGDMTPTAGLSSKCSNFHVLESEDLQDDSSDDADKIPKDIMCPVCLDLLYSPLKVQPCGHIFCEPCLRRVAHPNPTNTLCPLCRHIIGQCMPCRDIGNEVRENYGEMYRERHQFEQEHSSQHMPLPWIRDFRRQALENTEWTERISYTGRTFLWTLGLNIIGLGILIFLNWLLKNDTSLTEKNSQPDAVH
ncbi:E3 ubiquitin-protein ligase RNF180-like isoform X2 [Penaeus japonicus]|uniref:E3 ubiquitin-protein ligase RNF180-like isoform X2 n=1 Tax=Penaeus japonicus TaxID=27405 RepID=UPI001C71107D|nr:E3 ubiquitin-protein ligase RNF180-like isoform X2 [Penaeus japonicus]